VRRDGSPSVRPFSRKPGQKLAPERSHYAIVSTTSALDGRPVSEYVGVVTGEAVLGANVFRKLFPKYKPNGAHVLRYDSWYHKRGALRASRIGQSLETGSAAWVKVIVIAGAPAFLLTSVGGWVPPVTGSAEVRPFSWAMIEGFGPHLVRAFIFLRRGSLSCRSVDIYPRR
jgi:hypothetical protein